MCTVTLKARMSGCRKKEFVCTRIKEDIEEMGNKR